MICSFAIRHLFCHVCLCEKRFALAGKIYSKSVDWLTAFGLFVGGPSARHYSVRDVLTFFGERIFLADEMVHH